MTVEYRMAKIKSCELTLFWGEKFLLFCLNLKQEAADNKNLYIQKDKGGSKVEVHI